MKVIVPALITSSKEKNTGVKAAAESALMYVLRLRDGDTTLQVTVSKSDSLQLSCHGRFIVTTEICHGCSVLYI